MKGLKTTLVRKLYELSYEILVGIALSSIDGKCADSPEHSLVAYTMFGYR